MSETNERRLELENAYRFPMRELGNVFKRACEASLTGPEVVFLENTYLPKPDQETSPRIRIEVRAADATTITRYSTKTKAHVQGGNGVKWEKEEVIEAPRRASLVSAAQTPGVELAGNYKLRLRYRAAEFENLKDINVYLDFIVTYDGRFIGPLLEVEVLLERTEEVVPALPQLQRLADLLLGTVAVPMVDSCRTLSEKQPPAAEKAPERKKKKKKKKKKKN